MDYDKGANDQQRDSGNFLRENFVLDSKKIYAENIQTVNQQFQLTLSAIAIFGISLGWLSRGDCQHTSLVYVAAIILVVVFFLMFWYGLRIRKFKKIGITYLLVKYNTVISWEKDWAKYREDIFSYSPYTETQALLFFILSISTFLFPIIYQGIKDGAFSYPVCLYLLYSIFWVIFAYPSFKVGIINPKVKKAKKNRKTDERRRSFIKKIPLFILKKFWIIIPKKIRHLITDFADFNNEEKELINNWKLSLNIPTEQNENVIIASGYKNKQD